MVSLIQDKPTKCSYLRVEVYGQDHEIKRIILRPYTNQEEFDTFAFEELKDNEYMAVRTVWAKYFEIKD